MCQDWVMTVMQVEELFEDTTHCWLPIDENVFLIFYRDGENYRSYTEIPKGRHLKAELIITNVF